MRGGRRGRVAAVAVAAIATGGALPATASALQVTVTGDDGNPVAIGDVTIRNMDPKVAIAPTGGEKLNFKATFVGPDGVNAATPTACVGSATTRTVDFRGNGAYTVTVQTFGERDFDCNDAPSGAPTQHRFTINASVTLAGPPAPVLLRQPG